MLKILIQNYTSVSSCTPCSWSVKSTPIIYSALESLSVGCWCVSARKPIPTSETTHNGAGHFPPSHLAPRSTLSFCFRPTRSSPTVFVYSFPSHFFLCVSYRWILKFSVFGLLNAKQCLNCPATELGASTEKHRSIHSVWF